MKHAIHLTDDVGTLNPNCPDCKEMVSGFINPVCCVVCMFREKDPKEIHANVIINGYSLCWPHATKVMNREDQMQGYARWMVDTEDNGRW